MITCGIKQNKMWNPTESASPNIVFRDKNMPVRNCFKPPVKIIYKELGMWGKFFFFAY